MSILETMRDYSTMSKVNDNYEPLLPESDKKRIMIQSLGLRPRRPSIKRLIGDNNPIDNEDFEELKQLYKFGRISE